MARHASAEVGPYLVPSYYLTPDTKDYPLALLLEGCAPDPDSDLPVAHGVKFADGSAVCDEHGCYATAVFVIEVTESGGGNPAYEVPLCAPCTVGQDIRGLIPMCYIEFVPYE